MIHTIEYSCGCKGDLYLPDTSAPENGYPAVLLIHGGAWNSMDRSAMAGVAQMLHSENFAVFNIDYRLAPQYLWPCGADDCLLALKYLIEKAAHDFNLDLERIFVAGGSSGGHYALLTGLRADEGSVAGIISFSGINDVYSDFRISPERYKTLIGHTPTEEELKEIDPAEYYYKGAPPVLCTHFIRDDVVTVDSSLEFIRHVRSNGGNAALYLYDFKRDGEGHALWIKGTDPRRLYPDLEQQILFFLRNSPPCGGKKK